MPTTAKIILDTRNKNRKKGYPFTIYISNAGKKYISLRKFSTEKHWNGNSLLKSHPEYKELNAFLIHRQASLIKEVEYCNANNLNLTQASALIKKGLRDKETRITQLKRELSTLEGETNAMLLDFWEQFIKDRRSQKKSTSIFEQTKKQVSDYLLDKDMRINDVTYEFINDFSNYKLANGCSYGGINTYLSKFKTVYLEAQKRESLNIKAANPFRGTIKKAATKEIVEMTVKEMAAFKSFTPKKETSPTAKYKMIRRLHIWLFQFYIGGHDFVDIASLEWSKNIRNGRIRFRRYKNRAHTNGGPLADNILCKEALEILEQYGTKERDRVFSFIPHPSNQESYASYRKNTNRALKKISQQTGIRDIMKTKSTRYIFKTWADEMQLDIRAIMQIQGHAQSGVSARYGARLPNKIADLVLNKVVAKP